MMWEEYLHLLRDPAHLMVEVTFMVVVDVVLLGIVWPLLKRSIRREHLVIDAEHGVDHKARRAMAWVAPRSGGYTPPGPGPTDPVPPTGSGAAHNEPEARLCEGGCGRLTAIGTCNYCFNGVERPRHPGDCCRVLGDGYVRHWDPCSDPTLPDGSVTHLRDGHRTPVSESEASAVIQRWLIRYS